MATAFPLIGIFPQKDQAEAYVAGLMNKQLIKGEAEKTRFHTFWDLVHVFTPETAPFSSILGQNLVNRRLPLETAELCLHEIKAGHSVVLVYPPEHERPQAETLAKEHGARLFRDEQEIIQEVIEHHEIADELEDIPADVRPHRSPEPEVASKEELTELTPSEYYIREQVLHQREHTMQTAETQHKLPQGRTEQHRRLFRKQRLIKDE